MIFDLGKDFTTGFEVYFGSRLICVTQHLQRCHRHTHVVFLRMGLAVTVDVQYQLF